MRFQSTFPILVALVVTGCASSPDGQEVNIFRVLDDYETRDRLEQYFSTEPDVCVDTSEDHEVCGWQFSNRAVIWKELADAINSRHQIMVVCDLPRDGSRRDRESCAVWGAARLPIDPALARARRFVVVDPASNDSAVDEQSAGILEASRTIVSMSHVLGHPPHDCLRRDLGRRLCYWNLTNRSAGYEIAAAMLETRHAIKLSCFFDDVGNKIDDSKCLVAARP